MERCRFWKQEKKKKQKNWYCGSSSHSKLEIRSDRETTVTIVSFIVETVTTIIHSQLNFKLSLKPISDLKYTAQSKTKSNKKTKREEREQERELTVAGGGRSWSYGLSPNGRQSNNKNENGQCHQNYLWNRHFSPPPLLLLQWKRSLSLSATPLRSNLRDNPATGSGEPRRERNKIISQERRRKKQSRR